MSTLIVRPPWAAQSAWTGAWVSPEPDKGSKAAVMSWAQAHDLPPCRELILAVPASLLSWHTVTLPKLAGSRWRTALDSLLEEKLLSEANEVHLALAPGARGGQAVTVAACDKAWLTQALRSLQQAGREVVRIVPEFEPDGSGLYLLGQPDRGWLVQCTAEGVQCLALSQAAESQMRAWCESAPPEQIQAEPAWAATAERLWGQSPRLLQAGDHLQRAAGSDWNLAQFDLSQRNSLLHRLTRQAAHGWVDPAWRPVRWGLVGLLAVHMLGLQVWAWKERREQLTLRDEIQSVLLRSFPQIKVVIDPVLQMDREVQALARSSGQTTGSDMTRMLAAWAGLQAGAPAALDFKPGELTLVGWQPDTGKLPAWQARLKPQGYRLEPVGGQWVLRTADLGGAP